MSAPGIAGRTIYPEVRLVRTSYTNFLVNPLFFVPLRDTRHAKAYLIMKEVLFAERRAVRRNPTRRAGLPFPGEGVGRHFPKRDGQTIRIAYRLPADVRRKIRGARRRFSGFR